ncbi:glycosyltransferase [Congregibacter variabilis]|uniref:Glycosyltransferase n=1 Tax=Congregibacter variabilis TaxID=3081200 RepID=A0ABZ0I1P1_9GAMM|nr:glycosyltransferase [Congregibacter sp. IMCC43200]
MDKPSIVIIGPVLPFRGGIAEHTTQLSRALAQNNICRVISFKRLYPQWLFPGESDQDADHKGHLEANTEYSIDTLNPLTWLVTARKIKSLRPDLVLVPWWTIFLGPLLVYIIWSLKRNDIQVVLMCHNVLDHEATNWKRWLTRVFLTQASRFIVHSKAEAARLKELRPAARVLIHPHPIYDQYPKSRRVLQRRASLELLFYGFVRPYKGLDMLIEAMGMLQNESVFLTIAGEFWDGEKELRERIAELTLEEKVEIIPRYVSADETADLFTRADIVVLPYRSATGSGVIPIAYNYLTPVLATKVGGLPDVVIEGETGWLSDADPSALADALRGLDKTKLGMTAPCIEKHCAKYSWTGFAHALLSDEYL